MMNSQSLAGDEQTDGPHGSKSLLPGILGFLLFLTLGSGVEWLLFEYRQERGAELKSANVMLIENIRARLERELNDSSLFSAAGLTQTTADYEYALRGHSNVGTKEGMILGPASLFDDPVALVSDIAIPGGSWQLAVKSVIKPSPQQIWPLFFRLVGWLFAALFAALAVALWTLKRKLRGMALYDRLTGLPSRHLFLDRLKQVIRRTRRNRGNFSILSINLNEFKSINESHGEKVGDMLLAGIGKRLIGFIRHCDTVTRWVGDKFFILLDGCPHDQASIIAENLRHQIELPVYCGEHQLRIGASIGVATFPDDGHSLTALLKVADTKMVMDKSLRKI